MIAEQNRLLVENNVRMVQVNGSPGAGQWGLEGPNIYVYLRLAIDPKRQSANELFDDLLARRRSTLHQLHLLWVREQAEEARAEGRAG